MPRTPWKWPLLAVNEYLRVSYGIVPVHLGPGFHVEITVICVDINLAFKADPNGCPGRGYLIDDRAIAHGAEDRKSVV